jgi:FixJ family two-component response regulator
MVEAFDFGGSEFLNKPVKARELIDTINKMLSFRKFLSSQ